MVSVLAEEPGAFPFPSLGITPSELVGRLPTALLVHNGAVCQYASQRASEISGFSTDELRNRPFRELVHPDFLNRALDLEQHPSSLRQELQILRKDAVPHWVEYTGYKLGSSSGPYVLVFLHSIQLWKDQETQIAQAALQDSLTGLGNRAFLLRQLETLIGQREQNRKRLALFFVDLDRLKVINDTLGHAAGDQVLVEVARRFEKAVSAGSSITRHGGDEFIVLIPHLPDDWEPESTAASIRAVLAEPIVIQGQQVYVTASIGSAVFPEHGTDPQELLQNSDRAMYRAKRYGGNSLFIHLPGDHAHIIDNRLEIEHDLRAALREGQLLAYYQPRIDARTRTIRCLEALVRWQHPTRGLVLPGEFIDICEDTGLIHDVGRQMLSIVVGALRELRGLGLGDLRISMNLSPRQFVSGNFLDLVLGEIRQAGLPPQALEMEITETALLANPKETGRLIELWRKSGMQVSLDDFGRGYSSLERLRNFAFTNLKIDALFAIGLPANTTNTAIVQAIILIARAMGLSVTAEGIEDAQQASALEHLGVDELQGYHIGRPMPFSDLPRWLAEHNAL